ncbi:hypothetical protein [Streptomyces sp. NPDC059781]|uniref:hypothetical protein n=1 Tax=unclassified Streptomyces TaxID=2593676 RepID=UPI0036522BE5
MKSWRTRAAAGLALGTALVSIPLTAGTASAATTPRWTPVANFSTPTACQTRGNVMAQQGQIINFRCDIGQNKVGIHWTLYVQYS